MIVHSSPLIFFSNRDRLCMYMIFSSHDPFFFSGPGKSRFWSVLLEKRETRPFPLHNDI